MPWIHKRLILLKINIGLPMAQEHLDWNSGRERY